MVAIAATKLKRRQQISPQTMLPDLLRACPQTREVFDRYGLRGCGGAGGPVESIGFFARTHGVAEDQLIRELTDAAGMPQPALRPQRDTTLADTIYRRFFVGGIVLILTFGATWGAWLLWRIGFSGAFTGVSIHEVNAHGHAQVFGWVGLFIMGFACQAFPRIWHTELAAPRLAAAMFVLMLVGLVVRTFGMALTGIAAAALPLAMIGVGLEIIAICSFGILILKTYRTGQQQFEPYVGFVFAAILWFIAMAGVDAWHTYATMTAASRDQLLWQIATYQAPLRDLQIHGLALFMILGVSIRMLPAMYRVPSASPRNLWIALGLLSTAVIGESAIFIVYRWTGNHAIAAALMAPWLMLAAGVAMVALPWKLWRRFEPSDRSAKFIRAAYAWLAISLVMLLLLPVYQLVAPVPFSHAFYGSIRHAITVGFVSLMIMGFAAKVVPTLNGVDTGKLSRLWGPFLLVNVGCFLRVSTQTLTDWDRRFFAVVGVSGTLEVIGLAWWGFGLMRIIWRGKRDLADLERSATRPQRILAEHFVADVIAWFPATQPVFDRFRFDLLRRPLLRRTIARVTTLSQAAALTGVNLDELLIALNAAIGRSSGTGDGTRVSLTVLRP